MRDDASTRHRRATRRRARHDDGLLHAPRVPRAGVPDRAALRRRADGGQAHRRSAARSAGSIYVPPRSYCPIDVVEMTEADDLSSSTTDGRRHQLHGRHAGPVLRPGGDRAVRARRRSLLDEPGGLLSLQDILDVPVDDVRVGMRVEAVWAPKDERTHRGDRQPRRGAAPRAASAGWQSDRRARPPGRASTMRRGVLMTVAQTSRSSATRSRRRGAQAELTESAVPLPGHRRRDREGRDRPARHRLHVRGELRLPVRPDLRVRDATSRPSARGRRSRSRTWRWTARGRCTRRGSACSTATSISRSRSGRARARRASGARSTRCRWTRTR